MSSVPNFHPPGAAGGRGNFSEKTSRCKNAMNPALPDQSQSSVTSQEINYTKTLPQKDLDNIKVFLL